MGLAAFHGCVYAALHPLDSLTERYQYIGLKILTGFLPCFFICFVFLYLLILLNLLCLGSPFCRLQVRISHCFWCLPPVAKVGSVVCVGFLVEGTGACVLVDGAGSCLCGG